MLQHAAKKMCGPHTLRLIKDKEQVIQVDWSVNTSFELWTLSPFVGGMRTQKMVCRMLRVKRCRNSRCMKSLYRIIKLICLHVHYGCHVMSRNE